IETLAFGHELQVLEGVRGPVAHVHPELALGDVPQGGAASDPEATLPALTLVAGGVRLAWSAALPFTLAGLVGGRAGRVLWWGRDAGLDLKVGVADVEDLGGQAEEVPGSRVDGQGVVALEALAVAVADGAQASDAQTGEVQFGEVGDDQ